MIEKIKKILKKRKVKVFLLFLLCSSLIWFMNNLSQTYDNYATFELAYFNAPDSLLLANISKKDVNVKLRAVGFQFLGLNFKNKTVQIDLSKVEEGASKFFIPHAEFRQQVESQLPGSMSVLEMDEDTLSFNFYKTVSKRVAVEPQVKLNLAQNYLLDGNLRIVPDSIDLIGPQVEIDTIGALKTLKLDFSGLTSDFSREVKLHKPEVLKNTELSSKVVVISGRVARFSEKVFEVPIEVVNVPAGLNIQMFPDKVPVLCKAKISDLKNFAASNFTVVADYGAINDNKPENLPLELQKMPQNVHSASLGVDHVEFVLKKEK